MSEEQQGRSKIGFVLGGGLKENLQVRLDVPAGEVSEGAFVVIGDEGDEWLFHGLITDIRLNAIDPRYAGEQSSDRLPPYLADLFYGRTLFTDLEVLPALMTEQPPSDNKAYENWSKEIETGLRDEPRPLPIKTVPSHHTKVWLAAQQDIALIFGDPNKEDHFTIGKTREQGHPVAIDLGKFVKRSAGIFGATGTGKSFLARLLLAGLIHHNVASVLVLDMHNEYGFDDTASDTGEKVVGLKTKFGSKVQVVGLGSGAQIRGKSPDFNLEIPMADIQPQDIELLTRALNLKETTATTLEALVGTFNRKSWFKAFMQMEINAKIRTEDGEFIDNENSVAYWADSNNVNVMAAEGLHNKMRRIFSKADKGGYIVETPAKDTVREVIKSLEAGQNVVLSFGNHEDDLDYLLVSNLLTRRIRDAWEKRTNDFRSSGDNEPRPLVIAVEEAHKLLNREMAAQTTFSTIARELRKYYVTLLIIDQRPSQIYDEVMSQLGTRISGWLGDEDDIHAVLSGLAGREALRGMLARLQPKEEVLLLGWGVPMPLRVCSRRYDDEFWKELLGKKGGKGSRSEKEIKDDLGLD